jgi:hypothetical protein
LIRSKSQVPPTLKERGFYKKHEQKEAVGMSDCHKAFVSISNKHNGFFGKTINGFQKKVKVIF